MSRRTRVMLMSVVAALTFSTVSANSQSAFMQLCNASIAKIEPFLAECRKNARPFKRSFYPSGSGAPVPEEHAAWFDMPEARSHFGFGCVLGPNNQVRFLGLYFAVNPDNFRQANSTEFAFIDFDGDVGLRPVDRAQFILLAVRRFSVPGREPDPIERNCQPTSFDPVSRETVFRIRAKQDWLEIFKVSGDNPSTITQCSDRELPYDPNRCFSAKYHFVLGQREAPIIFGNSRPLKITDKGGMYVEEDFLRKSCTSDFRASYEPMNIVKEICDNRR